MNQQRQVVYDLRNQALSGENMRETVMQIIEDYIVDEIELSLYRSCRLGLGFIEGTILLHIY